VRITGGQYRGRVLKTPSDQTIRPASDKVRQAVFNMLISYNLPQDAVVLDLFCGTGSYGLEALSRGAQSCHFIDKHREACSIIQSNLETLGASGYAAVIKKDVLVYSADNAPNLIFIDPPYNLGLVEKTLNYLPSMIDDLSETIAVIEMEKENSIPSSFSSAILKQKNYGISQIIMLDLSKS
jgi:16S rRNA (guanine966-N2)-methyltransferase